MVGCQGEIKGQIYMYVETCKMPEMAMKIREENGLEDGMQYLI